MPKQIIIAEQHQTAAVFSEEQIQELVVSTGSQQVSDIYVGTVENVIPGIDAAFVNIGDAERNGFIHVTDLGPLRLRRSAAAITELLTPKQKVLVQVMKEPTGNKGPRLTGNVSLPGRYLVLMPYGRGVNLSRRIMNESERSRLRALAILIKPAGMGLLVRTEAEDKAEEAIIEDLEYLQKQWESIQQQATVAKPPMLLNRDDDFIQRVLRDMFSADVNRIVVDSSAGVKRIKDHLRNWGGGQATEGILIDYHRDRVPLLDYFRVNAAIREAMKPRVDLPSGGYIIIEPTEALTVIDVNSGSFTRSATSRETVLWTNYEAATEIARQLRLRNIGGVIVVDFIDMDSRRDQLALLEHFTQSLRADKARPQVAQLSELGLVELTRKRQGQNIYELFGVECSHCGGLGHLCQLPGEEVPESLEKVTPAAPPVLATKLSDKRGSPFKSPFDVQAESPASDLELVNHPSYQEPNGGSNGSRRRRRRRNESEAPSNPAPRVKPRAAANGQRHDVQLEEVSTTSSSSVEVPPSNRYSSSGRNLRRDPVPPPVETVEVEMTPLEQDVYALMGISPLIRVDRDIKDPKAVAVTIRNPGEVPMQSTPGSNPDSPPPRPRAATSVPLNVVASMPDSSLGESPFADAIVPSKPPQPEVTHEASEETPPLAAIAETRVEADTDTDTDSDTDSDSDSEVSPTSPRASSTRRRRRRSSARS